MIKQRDGMTSETVKTVLIVEDSSMTRSMIRALLEEMDDIDTVEAASGFEALKLLPSNTYDLIITDINMPDINGLELINFIRKNDRYKEIPLMIVSTEKSEDDRRRGLEIGANDYVTKPFKPDQFQGKVKNLLKI